MLHDDLKKPDGLEDADENAKRRCVQKMEGEADAKREFFRGKRLNGVRPYMLNVVRENEG